MMRMYRGEDINDIDMSDVEPEQATSLKELYAKMRKIEGWRELCRSMQSKFVKRITVSKESSLAEVLVLAWKEWGYDKAANVAGWTVTKDGVRLIPWDRSGRKARGPAMRSAPPVDVVVALRRRVG